MKTLSTILFISILAIACGRPDAVNTREEINESVDGLPIFQPSQPDSSLYGVYRGVLSTEQGDVLNKLSLYEDDSFYLQQRCLKNAAAICEFRGKFKYDKERHSIRYTADGKTYYFAIEENMLHQLDENGKKVQAPVDQTPYLTKSDIQLGNTIWQFEIIDDSLVIDQLQRFSYLRFLPDGNMVYNLNCNSCRARWVSLVEGEIVFKDGICTKKLCDTPYEDRFNALISSIQYYEVDGNKLILSSKDRTLAVLKSPF